MCHRYIQTSDLPSLQRTLPLTGMIDTGPVDLTPRHNIRPAQQVPVVHMRDGGNALAMMQWGMRNPSQTEGKAMDLITELDTQTMSGEVALTSLLQQRCLIPADGFYECEKRSSRRLQPWLVRLIEDGPFFFAGIWQTDILGTPDDHSLYQEQPRSAASANACALLTVTDNGTIAPLALRVPVILAPQDYATWLDPTTPLTQLKALLKPYRESGIYWHPVSIDILETDLESPALAEPAQLIAA